MSERSVTRGPIAYYLDYLLYPVAAAAAYYFDPRFGLLVAGCVAFTLAEYWIHRTALHRWFYHGTHEAHHKNPQDYVVLWYVPLVFVATYLVFPHAFWSGFTFGYVWFILIHHALHHWSHRSKWLTWYGRWHDLHHRNIRYNFGITHPLWDLAFGTYRSPK